MTTTEKIDCILFLLMKQADHLPGGKVEELKKWIAIHVEEKNLLRQEIHALRAELTREKKRATFYHTTADQYRQQVEKLIGKKVTQKQIELSHQ